jgi:predicted P-loop ATPase
MFMGTTNDAEYLIDQTGNRRFWPISCGVIDIESLIRDRDQLWAEALVRFKAGDRWYLTPEIAALAEIETEKRIASDPWTALVQKALPPPIDRDHVYTISPGEILEKMEIPSTQRNARMAVRVGQIIVTLGWRRGKRDRTRGQLFEFGPLNSPETDNSDDVGREAREGREAHSHEGHDGPEMVAGVGAPGPESAEFQSSWEAASPASQLHAPKRKGRIKPRIVLVPRRVRK